MTKQNNIQLPQDWKLAKGHHLFSFIRGVSYNKSDSTQENCKEYIAILRANNINKEIVFSDLVYVPKKFVKKEQFILKDDIVFAMSSGSKHLVGKAAISRRNLINTSFGAFCGLLRPNSNVFGPFLGFYFQGNEYKKIIQELSSGININNLKREHLLNLEIPLPPLPEQHRIVAKIEELFSELDKAVENLQTARQQLKTYRQSVLKHAFEGKLTAAWRESSKFGVQSLKLAAEPEAVYQTKNGLPEGWKVDYLQNLADIKGGVTKGRKLDGKQTINLPYLRVANVQDGYLDLSEIKYIDVLEDDLEKYRLELNDVLFTEGGDKDKLGRGSIWKNEIENCIHQNHIFRARIYSSNILLSKHLTYFAQSPKGKDYFFQNAKQTVNLASINKTILSNLTVPVCPIEEQNQIVAEIEKRFSEADKLEESIETALRQTEALRQSILKKAFAGKLVEPNENKAGE